MNVQKIQCPTKCLFSLGKISVVALFYLMSGFSLLHTAKQSKCPFLWNVFFKCTNAQCMSSSERGSEIFKVIFENCKKKTASTETQSIFYIWVFISPRSDVEVRLGEHDIWEVEGTEQHITSVEFIRLCPCLGGQCFLTADDLLLNQVSDPDLGGKSEVMAPMLSVLQLPLMGNEFRFTCITL